MNDIIQLTLGVPCFFSHALLDLAGDFPTGCVLVSLSRTRLLGVSLGDKVPPGVAAADALLLAPRGASAMERDNAISNLLLSSPPFSLSFPL